MSWTDEDSWSAGLRYGGDDEPTRCFCERLGCDGRVESNDEFINTVTGLPYCSLVCLLLDAGTVILETPDVWPPPEVKS